MLTSDRRHRENSQGFTLVEMAIVLVIIGSIIGGIFVGQELINTAQMRKFVSQIERYNAAVNAFKLKYNCLPGDCANAQSFFGATDTNGHAVTNGNGDGQINEKSGDFGNYWDMKNNNYETNNAFQELALAGLIEGSYNPGGTAPGIAFPSLPFNGGTTGLIVANFLGTHYWLTGIIDSSLYGNACIGGPSYCLGPADFTPSQGYYVSTKISDGSPTGQNLLVVGACPPGNNCYFLSALPGGAFPNASGPNNCYTLPASWNVSNTAKLCNLQIRASF